MVHDGEGAIDRRKETHSGVGLNADLLLALLRTRKLVLEIVQGG